MTNEEIENLIAEKRTQINKLTKEIEELKKQHSILSERYEIVIIVKDNNDSRRNRVYGSHKKRFSNKEKAKSYGCQLKQKIRKRELKINGEYCHIAMLDRSRTDYAPDYPVVWTR